MFELLFTYLCAYINVNYIINVSHMDWNNEHFDFWVSYPFFS